MSEELAATFGDDVWPIRTMLFVPSNRPDWVPKAADVEPKRSFSILKTSLRQTTRCEHAA